MTPCIRILALATCCATPLWAETSTYVEDPLMLDDYGVICDVTLNGSRPAPGTESGVLNIIDQNRAIDVTTRAVPAELGISFGIRATLDADHRLSELWVEVTHPPMGPNGVTIERWHADPLTDTPLLNLFTFEHDYELVQGTWHFRLKSGSEVLLEQRFSVFPAGTVPAVQQACFLSKMMS